MLEARQYSRSDICAFFRVPPHKIGDLTRSTFSNIEQQNIEFATDCIRSRAVRLEKRVNMDLIDPLGIGEPGEYFAEFLMEALMRGDQKSRYSSYAIGRQWGWLSANDVRSLESMNPIGDGGDEYMRPLNMVDANAANPDQGDENVGQEDSTGEGAGTGARHQRTKVQSARLHEFVRAAADRVVRKEVKALRKAEGRESSGDFARDVMEFYATHGLYVAESMHIEREAAERYAQDNRHLVLSSVNAIAQIEESASARLAALAMPKSSERTSPFSVHVEPHIHVAQPAISIQPLEVKMVQEPQETTTTAQRRPDGKLEFVVTKTNRKSGVAERKDGKVNLMIEETNGA
jgi:hypothetical protein